MAPISYLFKTVVDFTSPLSEADLRARFEDDLVPVIDVKVDQRLGPHIDGLTLARKLKLHAFAGPPAGFQAYPKFILTGDTTKSESFINTRIDQIYDDIKDLVETDIAAQGGAVLGWHRHLTSGEVDN